MTLGCDILWKAVSCSRFSDLELQLELPEDELRTLKGYVLAMITNMVMDTNSTCFNEFFPVFPASALSLERD
jgi:hypothetical protein